MEKCWYIEDANSGAVWSPAHHWTNDKDDAAVFTNYDDAVALADELDALCFEFQRVMRA
jgi:hypothetical protein